MNTYQQKWLDILQQANVPGWTMTPVGDIIDIKVPDNQNIRTLANNLETVTAELSLDINLPKERLKFVLHNSREEVEYVLNPTEADLDPGDMVDAEE